MLRLYSVLISGLATAAVAAGLSLGSASPAEGAMGVKVCGSGYGHGVGLSQWGAYGRAKAGQGYPRIIKSYYRGVSLKKLSANPAVRVLLGARSFSGSHDVVVRPKSKARLKNLATGGTVALGPGTYRVKYLPGKKLYRVTNVSKKKAVGSYRGPVLFRPVSGGPLAYGGKRYRGALLARAASSRLLMVNRLRMEAYLRGVVPNEMPSSWAMAALKSQAVAARSYAWATRRGGAFDFYADTRSQVYGGASSETRRTNKAVRSTARVAAVYGGKPITAFFHASSGGYTESSANVFSASPYLKAVRDVDPKGRKFEARAGSPWTRWSGTIDADGSPQLGVGSIKSVRVLDRSRSGRAMKIEVTGTKGRKTVSGQTNVRYALKTNGLKRADGSSFPAGDLPSARVSFGSACS